MLVFCWLSNHIYIDFWCTIFGRAISLALWTSYCKQPFKKIKHFSTAQFAPQEHDHVLLWGWYHGPVLGRWLSVEPLSYYSWGWGSNLRQKCWRDQTCMNLREVFFAKYIFQIIILRCTDDAALVKDTCLMIFLFLWQKDLPRVYREIEALKRLHHQHICQMFQIIETKRMIHLVLEVSGLSDMIDIIMYFSFCSFVLVESCLTILLLKKDSRWVLKLNIDTSCL